MKIEDFMFPCLSKKFLGIECMGCGTQRSFLMLCKGDFSGAFHLYPPIFTMVPFLFFVGLHFFDRKRNYSNFVIGLAIINAIVMVVSYVFKITHYI